MMINDRPHTDMDPIRELRVKVSSDIYHKLHVNKLLNGTPVRDVVELALEEYFRSHGLRRRQSAE